MTVWRTGSLHRFGAVRGTPFPRTCGPIPQQWRDSSLWGRRSLPGRPAFSFQRHGADRTVGNGAVPLCALSLTIPRSQCPTVRSVSVKSHSAHKPALDIQRNKITERTAIQPPVVGLSKTISPNTTGRASTTLSHNATAATGAMSTSTVHHASGCSPQAGARGSRHCRQHPALA